MSSINSCLSFTSIKTNGKWFLMTKGSKNKLSKRPPALPPDTHTPCHTMTPSGAIWRLRLGKGTSLCKG